MMVLVPLTVDRFVAVVFPIYYKVRVNRRRSVMMVLLSWCPLVLLCLLDIVLYTLGLVKVNTNHVTPTLEQS